MSLLPVRSIWFERSVTEDAWILLVGATPSKAVHPRPQIHLKALGAIWALSTVAGEVVGLVGLHRAVEPVLFVGGQWMLLPRLHNFIV